MWYPDLNASVIRWVFKCGGENSFAATAALLASPLRSRAQGKLRRIGYLATFEYPPIVDAWRSGLHQNGWIEGANLLVEYRYAETADRLQAVVSDLIALAPDLVIASGPERAAALKSATATIPIVFVAVFDPVALGLVQSLSHPGGNVTGVATYAPGDFIAKRTHPRWNAYAGKPPVRLCAWGAG